MLMMLSVNPDIAQEKKIKEASKNVIYVDKQGTMRWVTDNSPLALFGVNYTTPFAHAYRAHQRLGIPHEKAIDEDVYHFARLGLDAYRVHVWDCEISDTLGNLINNEHLRLFDYLLYRLKERGIKILITPIAYWGNGYPEPEEKTPGFSTKYGKSNCLTNTEAIRAQENYLFQFVNHVNQYTDIAYKDDPDIIAFEISNEPHHEGTAGETTGFINRMVQAIRRSGCSKPLFYNVSHSTCLAEAYYDANIQGGTFQWYPTGLVKRHELKGNFLPNVAVYLIPFDTIANYKKMARIVYEYDAADIGRSYIYPYIAKSFCEAGFQFATQFSYDPLHMAYANTEYHTHYMNLAYAPRKALSLKIAGEAFHRLPRNKKAGTYPGDTVFDAFRVSYKNDLAEMFTEEKFMYTNHTGTQPPSPDKLKHIAGYGHSSVVMYDGYGAYFLDRLETGVWRLEVMPDAIWVKDPFERASPEKEVSVIISRKWPMTINLPDLGTYFSFKGLNKGNEHLGAADGNTIVITPGTYLLSRKGKETGRKGNDTWGNITLDEFVAPPTTCKKTYVLHKPFDEIAAGRPYNVLAKVVSVSEPDEVNIYIYGRRWRPEIVEMNKTAAYTYSAVIDTNLVQEGFLRYYISVRQNGSVHTYPAGNEGSPSDWDFIGQEPYQVRVVNPSSPICLFDAGRDGNSIYGNDLFRILPSGNPGESILSMNIKNLRTDGHHNALRFYFAEKLKGRYPDLLSCKQIVLNGYSLTGDPQVIQVGLVNNLGITHAVSLTIQPDYGEYIIPLKDLQQVKTLILPNTYPDFLPYCYEPDKAYPFDLNTSESIQFSIGPDIHENEYNNPHGAAIEKIYLK
ncbi:MAG: hypothetical protein JW723_04795 [Bacteroidales bacterium]|nr:hypothetical protein [Bacteroidales bacterium]